LARALSSLLSSPALRAQMGASGEALVRRFHTWDIKYDAVSRIYAELVRTGKNPPSRVSYGEWKEE
jgi:glycosyltransferase involved in cell wall biosynthesis